MLAMLLLTQRGTPFVFQGRDCMTTSIFLLLSCSRCESQYQKIAEEFTQMLPVCAGDAAALEPR
jgi:hypothetical protein